MATHADTGRTLHDLADRFRSAQMSRRELIQQAGLLVGGSALASFLAAVLPPGAAAGQPAAATPPRKGGTLKVAIFGEAPSLDPMFTTATITKNLASQMFEGLVSTDLKLRPQPDLAESYEMSRDGKTATFKLRKGVTFHNGKEMTSADVVASLRRFTTLANRGKAIARRLDDIKAPDKYTVVMTFKQPTGRLPLFLAMGEEIIMPEEIATKYMKEQFKEYVGTGPFKFVERQPDRFTRFTRFDNYAAQPGEPNGWVGRKTAYLDELHGDARARRTPSGPTAWSPGSTTSASCSTRTRTTASRPTPPWTPTSSSPTSGPRFTSTRSRGCSPTSGCARRSSWPSTWSRDGAPPGASRSSGGCSRPWAPRRPPGTPR